ncbi:hypothetical protein [Halosolutus halophilus]|uniref:hypothetical protein n=1 Tax=Halosolutus halophilus TaxID=1552990 RepID=UPI0022352ACC|nr:hypothetical protein [Halosolutus halophilus]
MGFKQTAARASLAVSTALFLIYMIYLLAMWQEIEPISGMLSGVAQFVLLLVMSFSFTVAILLYEDMDKELRAQSTV